MPTAAEYQYKIACLERQLSYQRFVNASRGGGGWEFNEMYKRWKAENPVPTPPAAKKKRATPPRVAESKEEEEGPPQAPAPEPDQ